MSGGRPRTAIGTYGAVYVMRKTDRSVAETRFRDLDGRLRKVTATAGSPSAASALLKERLLNRVGYGSGGQLSLASPFGDLVALWLADLELRQLADGTTESYRDQVRLHVLPAFEHFALGEVTTGRVEWFLKSQATISHPRAKQSRTMLNLLFEFALRHDAIARNPVEGTSALRTPKHQPQALTLQQIAAIREAAAKWRTDPGQPGPKPDGQVRDIIEILLGTAMRPGEVLALRPCDVEDRPAGMVVGSTAPWFNPRAKALCARVGRSRMRRSEGFPFRSSPQRCCDTESRASLPIGPSSRTEPADHSAPTTYGARSVSSWSTPVSRTRGSACAGTGVPAPP
jgi:hypothetical protein